MGNSQVNLNEFLQYSRPKRPPCKIGLILADESKPLTPKEIKELKAAFEENEEIITNAGIAEWLEKRNLPLHSNNVRSHRRKECRCYKP